MDTKRELNTTASYNFSTSPPTEIVKEEFNKMKIESQALELYTELAKALQIESNGHCSLSKSSEDWTISCDAMWTKRRIRFSIHFSVPGTKLNYPNFRIGRSKFLGVFLRQNSLLSQRGTTSNISNLILSDQYALQLLEQHKIISMEWNDSRLTAFTVVQKKQQDMIKEIIHLFAKLSNTILSELSKDADES